MRSLTLLPALALALSVSACGGTQNRGLESVHQPVVTRTDYVYDLNGAGYGLTNEDARRLTGWFDTLQVGYGDRIAIDDPSGSRALHEGVARLAARYGLLIDDTAPVTSGPAPQGGVRVVVSRAHAEVPGCPDWSRTSQPEFDWHSQSNLGCAVNSNVAAMVANPEDLVYGRTASGVDTSTADKAIKSYRKKAPTGEQPLKTESTRSN